MQVWKVERFYGDDKGWSMFDQEKLTPEVAAMLAAEQQALECIMSDRYEMLVEVGCGYGRYMEWALSRGISYLGIDIVDWLVELAKLRAEDLKSRYPGRFCEVTCRPAERLASVSGPARSSLESQLVFFPFNCLGNVSSLEAVMQALRDSSADVVVSTFRTDATATRVRKKYYKNCGFSELDARVLKQGLLITSSEGFHAMAYQPEYLAETFKKSGFSRGAPVEIAGPGAVFHFVRNQKVPESSGANSQERHSGALSCSIHVIKSEPAKDAGLLSFRAGEGEVSVVDSDLVAVATGMVCETGELVRLQVNVPAGEQPPFAINFAGSVYQAESGRILVRLSRKDPRLAALISGGIQ